MMKRRFRRYIVCLLCLLLSLPIAITVSIQGEQVSSIPDIRIMYLTVHISDLRYEINYGIQNFENNSETCYLEHTWNFPDGSSINFGEIINLPEKMFLSVFLLCQYPIELYGLYTFNLTVKEDINGKIIDSLAISWFRDRLINYNQIYNE